ncbi:MAG: hypothetical protein JSU70_11165 [Phycisphaerales bacterium]|nr:MAG: hypothetical protein JSU70_11165 [Phycisphaerales bacterium]
MSRASRIGRLNSIVLITAIAVVSSGGCTQGGGPVTKASPAERRLNVDADYAGGNIVVERIEGDTIYLKPDLRDTEGWWFYWNFRVRGASGRTLTFQFTGKDPIGTQGPAISADSGRSWSWLGTDAVKDASFVYTFGEAADEVRFCFAMPYQQADLQRLLARYENNPNVVVRELCKTRKGRPVERVHAGRLDGQARHKVLLTARHHACEMMASYALEGALESVLADSDEGRWFRRNVEIVAIPFVDKDGVEDGDQGKNRRPRDHNRDYIGKSIYPSVAALRTFVPNFSNGRLKMVLDLHCPYIRGQYNEVVYIVGSLDEDVYRQQVRFGSILEDLAEGPLPYDNGDILPFGKAWNTSGSYGSGKSCSRWAAGLEGVRLAACFEIPYATASGRPVAADSARAFGRDLASAIRAYLLQTEDERGEETTAAGPVQVGGVFPKMAVMARGLGSNSEAGIGALIPWAEKLWAVGYVAHIRGQGLGLYEISDDMTMRRHPASITGTFTNRMAHWPSGQAFIGPHVIDIDGNVRTIEPLTKYRVTATVRHLTDPENKVYMLGMEGRFWEVDVHSLEAKLLFDLTEELRITNARAHFKSAYTAQGRVVVANNSYDEQEFLGKRDAGRLAEWDGEKWTIIERNPFIGVAGSEGGGSYGGQTIYATGWTKSCVVLRVLAKGKWLRYLLPKASHSWDHAWNTEWMRIRYAQTERLLMDAHGMFYDLPPFAYEGKVWGIRPICTHLRVVPDFCHWRGLFVMASDQIDHDEGQPQSGLWFGNIDDLWKMGKPSGWGGPWWQAPVHAGQFCDPFLMTGFDKKVVHLSHDQDEPVSFTVEVDFLGNGTWKKYGTLTVDSDTGYAHHEFPDGFSAHWVRVSVDKSCKATVHFMYN